MINTFVLADDLTGALECGCLYGATGADCLVSIWPSTELQPQVLVLDLESRHLGPALAAQRVAEAASLDVQQIYLKTDSTLRGPIGAQIEALMQRRPGQPLIYAPAYPRLGRTVRDGHLFVDGQPLEQTAFAKDHLQPSSTSAIIHLIQSHCSAEVVSVPDAETLRLRLQRTRSPIIYVCDGEIPQDIEDVSRVVLDADAFGLCAGPAGFLAALAGPALRTERPCANTGLVVNGSLHPASLRAIANAETAGFRIWRLTAGVPIDEPWPILTTDPEEINETGISRRLGELVRSLLAKRSFESLIIFGGDTAFAIMATLGVAAIAPLSEILPGVALSRIEAMGRDLLLVTKAGGFGGPETVIQIRDALRPNR